MAVRGRERTFRSAGTTRTSRAQEAIDLFAHGVLHAAPASPRGRAVPGVLLSASSPVVREAWNRLRRSSAGLERRFCDTYFGNFSVFQSAPDHWAVDHVFPVMPIHRLDEEPRRRGVLADLTCDSDGRIDRFIGGAEDASVLALHVPDDRPYYLAVFLLGAYQEILGDLHNLFGDTNSVHVSLDAEGYAVLDDVVAHDSVTDVLGYVGFDRRDLMRRMRRAVERAVRRGTLSLEESALFLRDYENGLSGTTYLEEEPADSPDSEASMIRAREPAPRGAPVAD